MATADSSTFLPRSAAKSDTIAPPWGLAAYVAALLAGLIVAAVRYRLHPDFEMVAWRLALGVLCNASCAVLGCYLVLRRMSLLGDAISHAVLPGIIVAYLLSHELGGSAILIGAAAVGLLTAILTQTLASTGRVSEDSGMGVVYTGLFAIGVILANQFAGRAHLDADCVLYGAIDLATVGTLPGEIPPGVIRLAIVFAVTIAFVITLWKELKITAFDPALARAMGVPVLLVHYALMTMVSIASVAAFEVVGSILVVAMLIVPAATASLLTPRLSRMLLWAAAIGAGSGVIGDFLAAWMNTSVAGMMSVVAGLHLFVAVVVGLADRRRRNFSLALRIEAEDILATLYRREEQAASAAIHPRGVLRRIAEWTLRRRGLIASAPQGLALTAAGRRAARSLVRSHRLWEAYLEKHFDLPADHLHDPAERMEHFITEEMQAELMAELDGKTHDPHGRAIPEHRDSE